MVSQAMSRPVPTAQFKRENFWPLAGGNYSPGDHRRCALLLAKATRQKRTSVKCACASQAENGRHNRLRRAEGWTNIFFLGQEPKYPS